LEASNAVVKPSNGVDERASRNEEMSRVQHGPERARVGSVGKGAAATQYGSGSALLPLDKQM